MLIGIYTRKSRISEKGESISNQIAICKEYCQSFENASYTIYEDCDDIIGLNQKTLN